MDTLELFIKRLYIKPSHIIGQLFVEENFFSDTLERPDLNNQPDISCIPVGRYEIQMLFSEHFQRNLPHLINVPNRSNVMIHPGNSVTDSEGCILAGKNNAPGQLSDSRAASNKLNAMLTTELRPIYITIS